MAMYKQVGIVGVGLLGGSLGLAVKKNALAGKVIGVSRETTIKNALQMGAIDEGFLREQLQDGLDECDLIILTSPVEIIVRLLENPDIHFPDDAVITDVGSTKARIMEAAKLLPETVSFIGGHPMTGSEQTGVTFANADLFRGRTYVIVPQQNVPDVEVNKFHRFVEALGANAMFLGPALHDQVAAAISHLPQVLAVALMNYIGNLDEESNLHLRMAGGGLRDMTRISSSSYDIWRDIFHTNADAIRKSLDQFIHLLQTYKENIDDETLQTDFAKAFRYRQRLD